MELKVVPQRRTRLAACSLCLRVRRGSAWVEAEAAIRELQTYERPSLPRFEPAVCSDCLAAILGRRTQAEEAIAA